MEKQMQQQQAQMTRLAAEKASVKKSISKTFPANKKESDAGRKKAIEDLKKIADEMQDVISDMKTKGVRPETANVRSASFRDCYKPNVPIHGAR